MATTQFLCVFYF